MELDLKRTIRQYLSLKDEVDLLSKRQSELKKRLSDAVDTTGEADDRGHITLTVGDDIKGDVKLTRQKRVSKTLDLQVAEDILTKRGIKDACIKMIPTLDEAAIMAAFYEDRLTEEDIDAMFPAKISYAFLVDVQNND
jgi:hypothetical protein